MKSESVLNDFWVLSVTKTRSVISSFSS